ncbi:MAG: branched-chain amino acid ABC transporter substrate-binding protein [Chitinophagales bacterium]
MSKTKRASRPLVPRFLPVAVSLILAVAATASLAAGPIKIGAAGPFTGDLSKIGLDSLNAIQMAVDEVNQQGGIAGRKVQLVIGDDAADPSKSLLVAEKFATDSSILGVIGPMNSSTAAAALPAYQNAGLAVISQSATNPDLSERGYTVFHRICPRDDAQGPAAARFMVQELKAKRIYVLDDKSTYGQGLADQVVRSLKGRTPVVERGQISGDDKDFSAILTRIKPFKPDVLFLALPNPAQAAAFVKQAAGLGLKTKFMAGDGVKEKDQFIEGAAGLAEGAYVTAIGRDIREVPQAKEFIARFEKKYGAMSIFSGQSYEATRLLLAAIKKVADSGATLDREKVLKAVHDIDGYRGILGFPIEFNAKGDVVGSKIYVFQVKNGDFVEVKGYAANTK